MICMGWLYQKK